jgi:hypothetical protein
MTATTTRPPPDVPDTDAGVIEEARHRQRRHRRIAAVAGVIAAGLLAIVIGSGGGGGNKPPTTTIASSPRPPLGKVLGFTSPRGRAQASFSIKEPAGVILLAQISVPHGTHAFVAASNPTSPYGGTARMTTASVRPDPSLACHTQGGFDVCAQAYEACPLGAAVWRLHVVKLSGPAGPIRVRFVVGPRSSQA